MHPGPAAGAGDDDERELLAGRLLDGPGQLLADDRAHAPHDEAAVGDAEDDPDALDEPLADDRRLVQAGPLLLGLDALGVGAAVVEVERVAGPEVGEPLLEGVGVEDLGDPLGGRDREVVVALGADVEVLDDLLAEEGRAAAVAAHPDPFGHPLGLEVAVPGVGRAAALPGHGRGGSFGGVRHAASSLLSGVVRRARSGPVDAVGHRSTASPLRPQSGATAIRLEAAGRDVVVELDVGVAAEVAGDQLGDRLAGDQADRLVAVPLDQGLEGRLDPVDRLLDRLALGRAGR